MGRTRQRVILILFLMFGDLFLIAGCGPSFSRQALDQVDKNIAFKDLQQDPDRYKGKIVMLAGDILGTKNMTGGTVIEVLQRPMSSGGRPVERDVTEGRFMVESDQYLDPAVYHAGRRVTVIGDVAGLRVQPLGEIEYRYPLIKIRELRLWEPRESPAQFHFGVGVGIFHGF